MTKDTGTSLPASSTPPLPGQRIEWMKRRIAHVVQANQSACYPTRNETGRRRWQRARTESVRWACIRQADTVHNERPRDIFVSPDGRIATGRFYITPGGAPWAYVREDASLWEEPGMPTIIARLTNELPRRLTPSVCTG